MSVEYNEMMAKLLGYTELKRMHYAGSVYNPTGWLWGIPPDQDEAHYVPDYCYNFEMFRCDVLSKLSQEVFQAYVDQLVCITAPDPLDPPDEINYAVMQRILTAPTKTHVEAYLFVMGAIK